MRTNRIRNSRKSWEICCTKFVSQASDAGVAVISTRALYNCSAWKEIDEGGMAALSWLHAPLVCASWMPDFRACNVSPCSVFLRTARGTVDEGELNSGAEAAAAAEQCRFSGLTGIATRASEKPKAVALSVGSSSSTASSAIIGWSDSEAIAGCSDAVGAVEPADALAVGPVRLTSGM